MPRYVILDHQCPSQSDRSSHWDLMLESGDVLRTWALESQPERGATIEAEALPDHRPTYLDYEGPLSRGRGSVTRWDAGTYELVAETDDSLVVELVGEKLRGRATLKRTGQGDQRWLFVV